MIPKGDVYVESKRQRETRATVSVRQVNLAELSTKARKKLKKGSFAIPDDRKYPIPDKSHAQNALARVSQHGTPDEKAKVRKAVASKYPGMAKKKTSAAKKGGKK